MPKHSAWQIISIPLMYRLLSICHGRTTCHKNLAPVHEKQAQNNITNHRPFQQLTGSGMAPQNPRPFLSISNLEVQNHMAAGTCFKCGLKFGPMHRCPPKTLQVLVGEDETEVEEEFQDAIGDYGDVEKVSVEATIQHMQLSELTSNGLDSFQTMKLIGYVGGSQVKVMVDSGASHCFISEAVVRSLKLEVISTAKFSVTLGYGSKVCLGGVCMNVPLCLEAQQFSLTCYVFPLNNVDIILGVSWLA